jgi:hypothetical protein
MGRSRLTIKRRAENFHPLFQRLAQQRYGIFQIEQYLRNYRSLIVLATVTVLVYQAGNSRIASNALRNPGKIQTVMARLVRAIHFPEAGNILAPLLENGWPPQGRP